MNQKVLRLTNFILEKTSVLPGLEALARVPYLSHGRNNPLFYLKFDLHFNGEIPAPADRLAVLGEISMAESDPVRPKDRFFLQDTPIHIHYKKVADTDALVASVLDPEGFYAGTTTYSLFRLLHGIPLLEKSGWLEGIRSKLGQVPERFWQTWHQALITRLEHSLSAMGAAHFHQDPVHFLISLARFLEALTEAIFTANREFAGPPEETAARLQTLERLPAGFEGLFNNLLRDDGGLDKERKVEIARLLTQSLLRFL